MPQILPQKDARQQEYLPFQFAEMASESEFDTAHHDGKDATAAAYSGEQPPRTADVAAERLPPSCSRNPTSTAVQAFHGVLAQLEQAHRQWTANAQRDVCELAMAIAERIVRRQLKDDPEIPLTLLREALEMVGRGKPIRVVLHPADLREIDEQVRLATADLQRAAPVEIIADQRVERGGCLVETPHGLIDQTLTAQLQRIRDDLDIGP